MRQHDLLCRAVLSIFWEKKQSKMLSKPSHLQHWEFCSIADTALRLNSCAIGWIGSVIAKHGWESHSELVRYVPQHTVRREVLLNTIESVCLRIRDMCVRAELTAVMEGADVELLWGSGAVYPTHVLAMCQFESYPPPKPVHTPKVWRSAD